MTCKRCGSFAINHHLHGRDGSDPDLCDVCYWRKRAGIEHDRSKVADAFIDVVISQLHYFDRVQHINLETCTAADITEMTKGAIIRYHVDRIFHAMVTSIVANLMQTLDRTVGGREFPDGIPCDHPGCLNHVTHPCEGCGRVNGIRPVPHP